MPRGPRISAWTFRVMVALIKVQRPAGEPGAAM